MWSRIGASQVAPVIKHPPANSGDIREASSIPGSGRCPGKEKGNPLQYPCLENCMDRGAWQATDHGVTRVRHNWAIKPPPQEELRMKASRQVGRLVSQSLLEPELGWLLWNWREVGCIKQISWATNEIKTDAYLGFCSYPVTKSYLTIGDPMDCSMSAFPVLHHLW